MVDCRPAAGAAPHDIAHSAPNGAPPPENHHNQPPPSQANNEMGGHGVTSPAAVRASTPATSTTLSPYTGGMNPGGVSYGGVGGVMGGVGGVGVAPGYMCGVKSLVWCAGGSPPPPHAPPPPPHGVNPHVFKSVQANGADLPMNDIPTLRYYFNLGVDCMWAAYGPPPPPPPRHFSPRDLAQDMQQLAIQERGPHSGEQGKHKPPDGKPPLGAAKGNGQRPLLGPRFKRGGNNQDGNQNQNHNHNKGHNNNNNMGNKGPNNRRNMNDSRGPGPGGYEEIPLEPALLPVQYMPYPPPLYPVPYYPVDADPGMMGMMGGMGYVGYEEGVEYGAPLHYYPPPHYAPPPPHPAHPAHPPHPAHPAHPPHPTHHEHK